MAKALVVKTTFTAVDKLLRPVKKMTEAVSKFGTKSIATFNRVERAARKMRKSIAKSVGKLGLALGLTALLSASIGVIKVFADFEQANVNLASVMGRTVQENEALIKDAKRLGAVTAKTATEVVGLQEAFARLGFGEKDILNMTQSTISGSIAMRGELSDTAELVGAMIKSFDGFESINAPDIIDQMTLATQKSALNFEKLQLGLPIVAGAANAAGVPFTRLLALLGKLSDAGIDTSSSATALRNIFIDSARQGLTYDQILEKIKKSQDKLTTANDEFGKRTAVSASILAKNIDATRELDIALQGAAGTAETAANKQLDTLNGRLTLLRSAWEGFIMSTDDGTGSLSGFLKTTVEVITEMLALASGTAKAKDELTDTEKRTRRFAKLLTGLLKTIKWITIAFYSAKVAMFAYNIAIGITGALSGTAAIGIGSSTVALASYKIASVIATAATWAFNAALWANPVVWIVGAIIALVAIIVILIVKWKEITKWLEESESGWAILVNIMFPFIMLIKSIIDAWKNMQEAFKSGGIKAALKSIGKSILSWILFPVETVLKLINFISGGNWAGDALEKIKGFRAELTAPTSDTAEGVGGEDPILAPEVMVKNEKTKNDKINIEVAAAQGSEAKILEDANNIVELTTSVGWQPI